MLLGSFGLFKEQFGSCQGGIVQDFYFGREAESLGKRGGPTALAGGEDAPGESVPEEGLLQENNVSCFEETWDRVERVLGIVRDEDEEVEGKMVETWHIGAGGAVIALSTPEGEREEMLTKLNGTLGVSR